MIIWNGLGFLVLVIVFVFSLAFNLLFDAWLGDGFYASNRWLLAISLFLSAITCWFLGKSLLKQSSRTVVDKETGEEFVLNRSSHCLFFIPMHIWAPILALIGALVLIVEFFR